MIYIIVTLMILSPMLSFLLIYRNFKKFYIKKEEKRTWTKKEIKEKYFDSKY